MMFIVAQLVILNSCQKDELSTVENLYGKWEVEKLEPKGIFKKSIWPDDFKPVVTFYEDGTMGLRLSRNGCGGNFAVSNSNDIIIEDIYCTLVCCDDEFSQKCYELLRDVTSYSLETQNSLKLHSGWVDIKLNRLN